MPYTIVQLTKIHTHKMLTGTYITRWFIIQIHKCNKILLQKKSTGHFKTYSILRCSLAKHHTVHSSRLTNNKVLGCSNPICISLTFIQPWALWPASKNLKHKNSNIAVYSFVFETAVYNTNNKNTIFNILCFLWNFFSSSIWKLLVMQMTCSLGHTCGLCLFLKLIVKRSIIMSLTNAY
jgi:hypothetical protein